MPACRKRWTGFFCCSDATTESTTYTIQGWTASKWSDQLL